jgi:hypothetical protein
MRKLLTLLPVAALVLAAGCQDQPTAVRDSDRITAPDAPELARVAGASFTSDNPEVDNPRGCLHGNISSPKPLTNCNLYREKGTIWINGGPGKGGPAGLSDGVYFFAVLEPGGQGGNQNPNDGTPHNLSDNVPFSTPPGIGTGGIGDEYTDRLFLVKNKKIIQNLGNTTNHPSSDAFENDFGLMIRVGPNFDDTRNPGGAYILAICRLGDDEDHVQYPVEPSNCKYDAFKVREGGGGDKAASPEVSKNAAGAYARAYGWKIEKRHDKTNPVNSSATSVTVTYYVDVTHDEGTVSGVKVTGDIQLFNGNDGPVKDVTIKDVLSGAGDVKCIIDGKSSSITQDIKSGSTVLPYVCDLGKVIPAGQVDNKVTIEWGDQMVDGKTLAAGTDDWTEFDIQFAATEINRCTDVTDKFGTGSVQGLGRVCVGNDPPASNLNPDGLANFKHSYESPKHTFRYNRTVQVVQAQCVNYDNKAQQTPVDQGPGSEANASVRVCGPIGNGFTLGFWSNKNGGDLLCKNDTKWRELMNGTFNTSPAGGYLRNATPTSTVPFYLVPATGACTTAHANFSTWLLNAKATNMSNMLSAQLAATRLNIQYKGMDGSATVKHPLTGTPASINSIIDAAIQFLRANGNTTTGDARGDATKYKDLFDNLNNNKVFAF